MPTYKNESDAARNVINAEHKNVWVYPGETVQTEYLLAGADWTETSPEPYYNPVLAVHSDISSSGSGDPQTIDLQDGCDRLEIYNQSTADMTVLLNAAANTPGYMVPANTLRTLSGLYWYVHKLVLQFGEAVDAGDVILHELGA
jgi:hypothetical protein